MNFKSSKANSFRKLSVWIISVYITANILFYLTGEYLVGFVNESVHRYLNQFLFLLVVVVVIMSSLNSIQLKKIPYILFFMLLFLSCGKKENSGYEVNGLLNNVEDSTMVYLANGESLDSSMVLQERFSFKGRVEGPTRVALYSGNLGDRIFFWLENGTFTIDAEKDNIRYGSIAGGSVQDTANILFREREPIGRAMDSVVEILEQGKFPANRRDSLVGFLDELLAKQDLVEMDFVARYPNSLQAVLLLNQNRSQWNKEKIKELFSKMDSGTKNTQDGKSVERYLELHRAPEIGEAYIDFEQVDSSGKRQRFSNSMGSKYTLIEFWASWCLPCRKANPGLIELYNKYSGVGFNIVGVSTDQDRERWLKAIEQDGLPWTNLTDLKGVENEAYIIYGVDGVPDNVLINEEGIIVGRKLKKEALEEKLLELL